MATFGQMLGCYAGTNGDIQTPATAVGLSQFVFGMSFITGDSDATMRSTTPAVVQWAVTNNVRLVFPFNLVPGTPSSPQYTLAQVASGSLDATITYCAQQLVTGYNGVSCSNAIWRIGWEQNGAWFPWGVGAGGPSLFGGQYANYIAAVQRVVTVARAVTGQNFLFCGYNPTVNLSSDPATTNTYPGDAYTDIVALDLYDQTNPPYPGYQAAWNQFLTAPVGLNWLTSFASAHGKKIALFEWGLGFNGGDPASAGLSVDDPTFVNNTAQWATTNQALLLNLWDDPALNTIPHLGDSTAPLSNAAIKSNLNLGFGASAGTANVSVAAPNPVMGPITRANTSAFPLSSSSVGQTTVTNVALGGVADQVMVAVYLPSSTVTINSVTAPNLTFTLLGRNVDTTDTTTIEVWNAQVTPAAAGTTVTITIAGSSSLSALHTEIVVDELSAGPTATWTLSAARSQVNAASTTLTYPSISSLSGTDKQAYWAYGSPTVANAQAGSTTGFTYTQTVYGDQVVFNGALAASTAYQPTGTISSSSASIALGVSLDASLTPGNAFAQVANVQMTAYQRQTVTPYLMLVVMENQQKINVDGNANAPFLGSLAVNYPTASDYWGTDHPSLPNYLELWSGSDQGVAQDNTVGAVGGPFSGTTLGGQLDSAGISWKAYFENLTAGGTDPSGSPLYDSYHNPMPYFTSGNDSAKQVDYTNLITDLNAAQPPQFVWITPNMSHNMHDPQGTATQNAQAVSAGDTWLSTELPKWQATNWYALGGIVIIVWDEAFDVNDNYVYGAVGSAGQAAGGGPVAMFIVSKHLQGIAPAQYTAYGLDSTGKFATAINHAGVLAGIEKLFALSLLADAATSSNGDLSPVLVASLTPPGATTTGKGNVACSAYNATVHVAQTFASAGVANVTMTGWTTATQVGTATSTFGAYNPSITATNNGVPAGVANVAAKAWGAQQPYIYRSTASSFPLVNPLAVGVTTVTSVTLGAANDLLLVGILVNSQTNTIASVTAPGLTFGLMGRYLASTYEMELWNARVPAAAAGNTVTVTIAGAQSLASTKVEIVVDEIGSYLGLDPSSQGTRLITYGSGAPTGDTNASTSIVYPALSTYSDAQAQCYWGYGSADTAATGGTSGDGFTYSDLSGGDQVVFRGQTLPSTSYTPLGTQTSSSGCMSIGIVITAKPVLHTSTGVANLALGGLDTVAGGGIVNASAGLATVAARAHPPSSVTRITAVNAPAGTANVALTAEPGETVLRAVDFETAPPVLRWATRTPELRWSTSPLISVD